MEQKVFAAAEAFSKDKHVLVPLFSTERVKVLLLCLSPGLTVPPHTHPGFDVTLQPLKGSALFPADEGQEITLTPGQILLVDGARPFSPRNPFKEDFQMLIHLVKR